VQGHKVDVAMQIAASARSKTQRAPHPKSCAVPASVFAGGTANKHSIGLAAIAKDFDCGSIYKNAQR